MERVGDIETTGTGAQEAARRRFVYVGAAPEAVTAGLKLADEDVTVIAVNSVAETLQLVTRDHVDAVIVDQSHDNNATALLIAMLASLKPLPRIVVIAQPHHVEKYLRLRGVRSVLSMPLRAKQIANAAGLRPPPVRRVPILPAPEPLQAVAAEEKPAPKAPPRVLRFSGMFMTLVSNAYKHAAFVLLASLFAAFAFYAILIAYFLLSSSWGAPVTLSKGHELVAKIEKEVGDMRVNVNLVGQRLSEAELEAEKARREQADAKVLAGYLGGTIDKEIAARKASRKTAAASVKRLKRVKAAFEAQMEEGGLADEVAALYKKRLIDKKTYVSNTLGLLESENRLAAMTGDVERAEDEVAAFDATIDMLGRLKDQLSSGAPLTAISAASADLILLTKQTVDARSALDQTATQMKSAEQRAILLRDSQRLLRQQIADALASPLGRAVASRVDVIFVPYANAAHFKPGTPLYSCSLTVILCRQVGQTGRPISGEANAVHPFFGKPIRGSFVEAILSDVSAASQEIIHASRPPFFF